VITWLWKICSLLSQKTTSWKYKTTSCFVFETSEWSCYNCLWMVKSVYAFQSHLLVKFAICMTQNLVIRVYICCFFGSSVLFMNGIFIGYSSNNHAYRVYNKRLMTVEESIHVVFDEINHTDQGSTKNYAEEDEQNIIL